MDVASTNARKSLARTPPTTRRARPFALPRSRGGPARRRPYRMRRPSSAREGVRGNRTTPGLRCGAPRGVTRPRLPRGRVARRSDHDPPLRSEHRAPLLDRRVRPASRIRRGLRGHCRTARFAGRRPRERRRVVPLSPPLARAAPTRVASRGLSFGLPETRRAVDACGCGSSRPKRFESRRHPPRWTAGFENATDQGNAQRGCVTREICT